MQVKLIAACLANALTTIGPTKRDTLLTTLLLLDVGDRTLRTHCLESIRQGFARIDEELVLRLYSAGDAKAKLAIACSIAVSRMRPRAFRKIFAPVYARPDLSVHQRWNLAWNLEHFLFLNPRQGPVYERIALDLARSPHPDLRIRGIPMVAQFARIDTAVLDLFARALRSRSPHIRLTTVNAFGHMVERLGQLAPDIRSFITSDELRKKVARMHRAGPDEDVRAGTWNLLKRYQRTTGGYRRR